MGSLSNKRPLSCKFLILLHLILGMGAVFGGFVLILDPSGGIIKMPISILEHSPFDNFLIPGMILFIILGVFPLIISFALVKRWDWNLANRLNIFTKMHWSWAYSLYIGFALIVWITVELFFIKGIALVHVGYIFLGLMIQGVTMLPSVQKHYSIK
ncbi:hypothetical protein Desdi_0706 [Desulfitobacterium dichloroeliminans LMG P-21439]|uniref:Uncharacterized protein n=1 Tax=Desulfitobacterium dichloroeliminans (strain LMG P-21439 / DCA1) TaxID=871963 RepID=L0F5K7_DESDL|nr:hypothetical protein [Desulfitobacterium dichloroeliminans]AGA68233.1 hypothetical protein Desdi_0706 [Desulfitobacterium dichloroeliminans LMG P-21439]